MRTRFVLTVLGISSALVGLAPAAAVAGRPTATTIYGYEEIGPHSLLADPSTGVSFMDPTCTPDFANCVTYEFWDRWDVALTSTEVDQTNVIGYIDNHGYDNFVKGTVKGTLTLVTNSGTWTGTFSGTFRAAGGTFSLVGTDGTRIAGALRFLDDGLMSLTGRFR